MKYIFPFIFISLTSLHVTAQIPAQEKNASVCQLIRHYFNNKAYDSLYDLTAPVFRMRVSRKLFENVALSEYAPLGDMKQVIFKKYVYGDAWYDAQFDSVSLTMIVRLDSTGKLEFFRLKKGKQNNKLPSNHPLQTDFDEKVEAMAQRIMMQEQSVGLSIGILKDGKSHFYGYGQTAKQHGKIPDSSTIFELASVTKVFTATLVANAVAEEKLQLISPVNNFLPDSIPVLQFNHQSVTIKDLANHTAGIPFMPSNFDSALVKNPGDNKHYNAAQLNSFLKHVQIIRMPGTAYQYSNAGFGLLADVLINVYHTSYEQLLENKILNPLNMTDTKTFIAQANESHVAKGYNENGDLVQSWDHRPVLIGHGGLASSARDMLKFAAAQIETDKTLLSKAIDITHQVTYSDNGVKIGLGWSFIKPGDQWVLNHTGGTEGYSSYFAVDTNNKTAIIILSNAPIALLQDGDVLIKTLKE